MEESFFFCVQRFERTPRPSVFVFRLTPRRDARGALETQASEPSSTAICLAAKRRVECAKVSLSWYFVFQNVADLRPFVFATLMSLAFFRYRGDLSFYPIAM